MVPPQHCPPAFSPEYSDIPMMMMVEPQQESPRPGRLASKDPRNPRNHMQQHLQHQNQLQEDSGSAIAHPVAQREHSMDEGDAEPILALPGPDLIVSSDDHQLSTAENSNPPQELAPHTTLRSRLQSQGSHGQLSSLGSRPQRQRRATSGSTGGSAASASASTSHPATQSFNGAKDSLPLSHTLSVLDSPSQSDDPATATDPHPSTTPRDKAAPIASSLQPQPHPLTESPHPPYTHAADDSASHSETPAPLQQHQRRRSVNGGLPLSDLLNSSDPIGNKEIDPSLPIANGMVSGLNTATVEHGTVEEQVQHQQQQQQEQERGTEQGDVSTDKTGVQKIGSDDDAGQEPKPAVFPAGIVREESEPQIEALPVGAGQKRGSRLMSTANSPSASPVALSKSKDSKDAAVMPAKKRAKTEASSKKSENDTASLFQKIFADRDPGKRKIKTKSVHDIPVDLAADEDDSDFMDSKVDSNDEDEDMVMPEDAASEDDIDPDQQESFNDEQDLLTALWQWKENDPEVCCVCLGRSTEADNVFVYCDTLDCALCVHQACYGVKTLPSESEPWLCDRCKAPPEEVVACVCCPSKDGAFRKLVPEDPSGGWIHVVCALWLPETTLGDPDNVDKISVRDIPEKNWNMTCCMCNDPKDAGMGACVKCDAGQCRKSFHITCAQGFSLLETIEETDMADPYFMYCKQHGASDGYPKLNGWLKWVRQRDAFLKKWQMEQSRKRTLKLVEIQQAGSSDDDNGEGILGLFEHSYSQFKDACERKIAQERNELSRQYSISYYLGNKIDRSRSRLEVISFKAKQAMVERRKIEVHTRNLLSSLLECAHYLESMTDEELKAPLSVDTTMAWYNSLPDTSRWKSNIQDIIETIDMESLPCDNPYTQLGQFDSGLDDSEGGHDSHRPGKGMHGRLSKKGNQGGLSSGKNAKSKKVHPKPVVVAANGRSGVVSTSSRGRPIKRDLSDPEDCFGTLAHSQDHYARVARPIEPCSVCHQLTLPQDKMDMERDSNGFLSPMAIKVLNRMVACETCHRQFHPKCLDPPMSRVPPRGYSWNCEECDSSDSSDESSGDDGSPAPASQHQQQHSSDLDEALMVLADTAMTMSANGEGYEESAVRASKRPLATQEAFYNSGSIDREERGKKIKTEPSDKSKPTKTKVKATVLDMDAKSKGKKSHKAKDTSLTSASSQTVMNTSSFQHVAPIIRGNLRIYPPGPHINTEWMKRVAESEHEETLKPLKSPTDSAAKKATISKLTATAKLDGVSKKKPKTELSTKSSSAKSKKVESAPKLAKGKIAATKSQKKSIAAKNLVAINTNTTTNTAMVAKTDKASPTGSKDSKEKTAVVRGPLPAVPVPPSPKPKEVIRYTVGEKTVEELQARDDVEIERRENVKFRKLRGRTLTMPAAPHEVVANAAAIAAAEAAAVAAQSKALPPALASISSTTL